MKLALTGLPALYLANVLLASNGVWCKSIHLDALTITALRCAVAAIALLALAGVQNTIWGFKSRRKKVLIVCLGVLMGVHWSTFFHAMQVSTVAMGILALYSAPVITVILEPLLDKNRPKPLDVIVALLVLAGLAIMVPTWSINSGAVEGLAFGLLSALSYACRNVFQRRWLQAESGSQAMTLQVCVAMLVCLPFAHLEQALALPAHEWGYLIALGLISTALSHTLIVVSLQQLSAKSVSLIGCFQPVLAILMSWLILNEVPSLATWLGGSLILGCALYEARQTRR